MKTNYLKLAVMAIVAGALYTAATNQGKLP
jgi:hypothetical protein